MSVQYFRAVGKFLKLKLVLEKSVIKIREKTIIGSQEKFQFENFKIKTVPNICEHSIF